MLVGVIVDICPGRVKIQLVRMMRQDSADLCSNFKKLPEQEEIGISIAF